MQTNDHHLYSACRATRMRQQTSHHRYDNKKNGTASTLGIGVTRGGDPDGDDTAHADGLPSPNLCYLHHRHTQQTATIHGCHRTIFIGIQIPKPVRLCESGSIPPIRPCPNTPVNVATYNKSCVRLMALSPPPHLMEFSISRPASVIAQTC